MTDPTPPYLDSLSAHQLKRFGEPVERGSVPARQPGPSPRVEKGERTDIEQSPPPAVMAASRGPQAAKHRLEMVRRRKITNSHVQRSAGLIKSRTKRAKK